MSLILCTFLQPRVSKMHKNLKNKLSTSIKKPPNQPIFTKYFGYLITKSKKCKIANIFRDKRKSFLRLFLFTANDNPHALGSHERKQAIAHARKLADIGVEIELFPLNLTGESRFDIRLFYTETITFDEEEVNSGMLDMSDKIMNLEQRLRQKEYKKRTLNRLLIKIGEGTNIAVKM